MRVVHVVNSDLACGYAEYARELKAELNLEFDSRIVEPGQDVGDARVVIASYGSAETLCLRPEHADRWRSEGRKVILLHRESEGDLVENCVIPVKHFMGHVDAIVTHEPTNYGSEFIPIAFPPIGSLPEPYDKLVVGECGFYSVMKHFEDVVTVARATGGLVNINIAPHRLVNEGVVMQAMGRMARHGVEGDMLDHVFLSVPAAVRRLAKSTVNMFWHHPSNACSQSTSVGLAIAAKRPLIISEHRRFRVIHEQYSDEVYVAKTVDDCIAMVLRIWSARKAGAMEKIPRRLYDAFSWTTCGETYRKLIHRVAGA